MIKPRPEFIYREETLNPMGSWICSRMTHDKVQYDSWQHLYQTTKTFQWTPDHRFVAGTITWGKAV